MKEIHAGPCGRLHQGKACLRKARVMRECITCERQGKKFITKACRHHSLEAEAEIRRHALTAHPVNLVRFVVAKLKGEA